MQNMFKFSICLFLSVLVMSCNSNFKKETFGNDLELLKQKINPIVLKEGFRQVLVSSELQGRVLISSSQGLNGTSYGWFDKDLISSDSLFKNISKSGGASRIWFGPDQGENNVFVDVDPETNEVIRKAPIDLDTLNFKITEQSETSVSFQRLMHIENLKHTHFYINIKRKIELLNRKQVEANLGVSLNEKLDFVGYSAKTTMTNIGNTHWTKEAGLISLWELGCMKPTPKTTIIIPLKEEMDEATVYFTPIDSTRIKIQDGILFYKADGDYLNKIGTLPENTLPYFGSYSPELNSLTIVKFTFNGDRDYVNSFPDNTEPYKGDVINIFNDGTWGDIGPFGPFYELETSSPAKALKVNESLSHTHETYHFEGAEEDLSEISIKVLGVSIESIGKALP